MALTVEDGTGIENADAYVEIDFVDTYATNYGKSGWTNVATDAIRETHIRLATQFIDNVYLNEFSPLTKEQRLAFPAQCAYVRGNLITGVPIQVKEAVAELAIISTGTSLVDIQEERLAVQRTVKAGDVSKSETFENGVYRKVFHPVEMILRPLNTGVRSVGQGVKQVNMVRS